MEDDPIDIFLKTQVEICGDITEYVKLSSELLKSAAIRIKELEATIFHMQMNQASEKEDKSKKKKKKKKGKDK